MPATLTKDEAHAFLDSRPGWLLLTTIGKDGYPHTVPVGYFRMGDDLYTGGREGTQRLANIRRNAKVSALVESGATMQDIKGLLIQADGSVVSEPSEVLPLLRESMRQRGVAESELPVEARPGVAYIKITPRRYVSWDYSRDGPG
jgi:hypothetical protein